IGKTVEEAFPGLKETEVPARYREAAANGKIWRSEDIQYEGDSIRGSFEVVAFQTEPGKMAAMFNEITARKKAELALKESEKRLAAFLENSPEAFFAYDLEGRILQVNACACENLGYSRDELMSMSVMDVEQALTAEEISGLWRSVAEGSVTSFEGRQRRKDGSSFPTEVNLSAVRVNDDTLLFGFVKDLTERKQIEREKELYQSKLIQAQKMEAIGTLAGGIAHDFNNLLMGIQGRASIMSIDLESAHPCMEHVTAILAYTRSAADLTKQLLGVARGGKYEVKPIDINDVIQASATMFGRTKKEIRIHQKLYHPSPVVLADRRQIEQAMLNLYVNAWQAMPEGGELYLETSVVKLNEAYCKPYDVEPGSYAKISVTDTGVGMDRETCKRIFDPFFSTKGMGRGTGLGLASVYGILKNHAGLITVYSEVGKGTTFNIYLPHSRVKAEKRKDRRDNLFMGTETILLVDDEKMIIEVARAMLEKLGYRVICALGGRQAVDIVSKNAEDIDLVILDMIMPDLSGEMVFGAIGKTMSAVPVILSSGYSLNGEAERIIRKGCAGFIQKPFDLAELSRKVREILDKTG
ncbi:MAG: PAS domain S-box protein, partial [Desulfosarcinaceae bacterium]